MLGGDRGQTIPFWTFAVLGMLAMMLFATNYAAQATWNVRAQSAADSSAASGLSVVANIYNEENVILYATALDEYRIRVLNQAILDTIWHQGGCTAVASGTCASDYAVLVQAYGAAEAAYKRDIQLSGQANNFTEGGQQQAEAKAAVGGYGQNCNGGGTTNGVDCSFAYTVVNVTNQKGKTGRFGGDTAVEVIACRNVSYFGNALLGLGASFQAIGHGMAATTTATTENFSPGTTTNPATSKPYQPTETKWYNFSITGADANLPAYQVPYATSGAAPSFTVKLTWYNAVPIKPATAVSVKNYTCQ